MPTNITYKNSTLATITNGQSKILKTIGKYMEDDLIVTNMANNQSSSVTLTPTTYQQTQNITPGSGYEGLSGVTITVDPIPSSYIIPAGTINITSSGTYNVTAYSSASVNVQPNLTTSSVVPSESAQNITPGSGYDGLSQVSVAAITSTYVGSGVPRRSASDITKGWDDEDNAIYVSAPSGYYENSAYKTFPPESVLTTYHGIISVTPTESTQTLRTDYTWVVDDITINPITPTYVGSGVTTQSSLTVNANTITANAGYYASAVTYTMPYATGLTRTLGANTPTVHVSNSGLITSQVTQANNYNVKVVGTAGYADTNHPVIDIVQPTASTTYQLDTQSATTIIPSESTQTLSVNQKYMTGNVTVAAITSTYVGSGITRNPAVTVSGPSVTIPVGYYSSQQTKTVASGSIDTTTEPTVTCDPNITVSSSGLITSRNSGGEIITINVNPGYIASNATLAVNVAGTSTYQLSTLGAQTITPSSSTQTVSTNGKYMTGNVTVNPIPSQYIVPSGTYTISSVDSTNTFNVTNYASAKVIITDADSIAY